jgi:hypothetical protein
LSRVHCEPGMVAGLLRHADRYGVV